VKKYRYKEVFSPTIALDIVVAEESLISSLSCESDSSEFKKSVVDSYIASKKAEPFYETSLLDFQNQVSHLLESNPHLVEKIGLETLPLKEEYAKELIAHCLMSIGCIAFKFNLSLSEIADSAVSEQNILK